MGTRINTNDIKDTAVTSPKLERDVSVAGSLTINGWNGVMYAPVIKVPNGNYLPIEDGSGNAKPIAVQNLVVGAPYGASYALLPGVAGTSGNAYFGGDILIQGNLDVKGTTTYINTQTLNIGDNILTLNADVTAAPTQDAGIEVERGSSDNVSLLWNEQNKYWQMSTPDVGGVVSASRIVDRVHGDTVYALLSGASFTGNIGIGVESASALGKIHIKGATNPTIVLSGNADGQIESGRIRFTETSTTFRGAFIHYDGSLDTFNIGVHANDDATSTSDVNSISISRANSDITLIGNVVMGAGKTVDGIDISAHAADDTRHLTADRHAALAGTSGTAPSVTNKFVDNADTRLTNSRTPVTHGDSLHNALAYFDIVTDGTTSKSATTTKQNVRFTGTNGVAVSVSSDTTYDAIVTINGTHNHDATYLKINPGVGVDQTLGGNLILTGNLTVSGTTTYVNTSTLNIGDNIITLNADLAGTADPTENAGVEVKRGNKNTVSVLWNETNKYWELYTPDGSDVVSGSRIVDFAAGDQRYMSKSNNIFTTLMVGDGTAYGDVPFVVANSANNDDSTFLTVNRDGSVNPVYSIYPGGDAIYTMTGAYFNNGSWVHNSNSVNSHGMLFAPGTGVQWRASNNSSVTWNVANDILLWNDSGYWKQPVQVSSTSNSYFIGGGFLGVGKGNPGCVLDVERPDNLPTRTTVLTALAASKTDALMVKHKTSSDMADGFGPNLAFAIEDNAAVENKISCICASRNGADNSGDFTVHTANAGTLSEKFRITKDGYVSIGSTAPSARLHVKGSDTTEAGFLSNGILIENTNATASDAILSFKNTANTAYWTTGINQAGKYMITRGSDFSDANAFIGIDTSGKLGIGTISPGEKLEVSGGNVKAMSFIATHSASTTGTGCYKATTGNGNRSIFADDYNYIGVKSYNDDMWFRSASGKFTFQTFDDAEDYSKAFQFYLPDPAVSGGDNLVAEIGQRSSAAASGTYKGVRIVHYTGSSIADGYLQAGDGVFNSSLKVGANAVWHAGNFNPTLKLDASADKYLSGVSGTAGGTITFTIANGTNITWNSSHTHAAQNAITKVTAVGNDGSAKGTYTAATAAGEVKIKEGTGITLDFNSDTITINTNAGVMNIPRSTLLTFTSDDNYAPKTFTHNMGNTNYVVVLGVNSPQRHVYYQKSANSVTVYLDDTPYGNPTIEVSMIVQAVTN